MNVKYAVILNGTNFPYYLKWDPSYLPNIGWTPIKASAYLYFTEEEAKEDIESMGLDAYVKEIEI